MDENGNAYEEESAIEVGKPLDGELVMLLVKV